MITFIISLIALIVGYFVYGRVVEHIFTPDNRPTPAISMSDGVDYVVLPGWKIFMIQFLNIAGTGPIFGAIMGAKFGPSAYLWIVLGCIFAGAVHDYLSGMLSVRHGGAGLPELVGIYLGGRTKKVMLVFSIFLLLMVGAVFVYSPALILGDLCGDSLTWVYAWCVIIFAYYFLATMLPIDKIIGKIYPFFRDCHAVHGRCAYGGAVCKVAAAARTDRRSRQQESPVGHNFPMPVHHHSMWGYQRIPRHTESAHGTVHEEREARPSIVLRGDDNRRRCCADMGHRVFIFLLRRRLPRSLGVPATLQRLQRW